MMMKTAVLAGMIGLVGMPLQAQEQTAAQKAEVERAKVRLAMLDVSRRLAEALNAGRLEDVADCYTDDAALMPPGAALVGGRAAVSAYFKDLIASGKLAVQFKSLLGSFEGPLGYDAGRYQLAVEAKGGGSRDVGKYVSILRKGADGKWRIAVDIWNSDAASQ